MGTHDKPPPDPDPDPTGDGQLPPGELPPSPPDPGMESLARQGELDERWRAAFTEVPRHEFIPELVWRHDRDANSNCDLVPLRRCGFEVTSSASMPAVVAQMLAALEVEPGMRVLEIGTGTGYNAALLAHRLGAENVVSVEVDPAVAEHAPYYPGGLLALTVHRDTTATGRIVGPASFMWLRAQRIPRYTTSRIVRRDDTATTSTTDLHPCYVAGDANAATTIGLRVPQCESFYHPDSSETGTLYLVDQWSHCWATLHITTETPHEVRQSRERKLWDEVQTAHRWWLDMDKPAADAWRFTIDPGGQRIELLSSSS